MIHPIPSGTRDVLPDEMRELRAITEALRDVFGAPATARSTRPRSSTRR
jgi:ATP phosphoribosyltransferase regulatory subunit HisZ